MTAPAVDEHMHRVGQRILGARQAIGMTQLRLAELVGLGRTSIANIEAGRQSISAVQLGQFARSLRVGIDALVTFEDLPPEPVLPHDVEVEQFFKVACRTCGRGDPIAVVRTRAQANAARDRHIAAMRERDGAGR